MFPLHSWNYWSSVSRYIYTSGNLFQCMRSPPSCSIRSTVGDAQVLHQGLVVCCHRNCLLQLPVRPELKHSANLKGGKSEQESFYWSQEVWWPSVIFNPLISAAQWVRLADSGLALPALRKALLQKRFGLVAGTAGSAAALSALPPRFPPDLQQTTQGVSCGYWKEGKSLEKNN